MSPLEERVTRVWRRRQWIVSGLFASVVCLLLVRSSYIGSAANGVGHNRHHRPPPPQPLNSHNRQLKQQQISNVSAVEVEEIEEEEEEEELPMCKGPSQKEMGPTKVDRTEVTWEQAETNVKVGKIFQVFETSGEHIYC